GAAIASSRLPACLFPSDGPTAAEKRAHAFSRLPCEARRLINEMIIEVLTGLRKFGVSICLSHQSPRQIRDRYLFADLRAMVGAYLRSSSQPVAFGLRVSSNSEDWWSQPGSNR